MMTATKLVVLLSQITLGDLPSTRRAKALYAQFRVANGFADASPALLTWPTANIKMNKSVAPTYGLSLAPWRLSGVLNSCMMATKGCRTLCLNTAGKGAFNTVQNGRIVKTKFLVAHPEAFLALLVHELRSAVARHDVPIKMRLNVLSDIQWEIATPWLFDLFSDVGFYDYTKHVDRVDLPRNYHLTLSASERMNDVDIAGRLQRGHNVTIVAEKLNGQVPDLFHGFPVIDGDVTDDRTTDPSGVVVFLKPKGKARGMATPGGFVRTADGFAMAEPTDEDVARANAAWKAARS